MDNTQNDTAKFAAIWDKQLKTLWDENYPQALGQLLHQHDVSSILDCAGGTGYPILELKKLGWDITYSDGSPEMLAFFSDKVATLDLAIPSYLSLWQELSEKVPHTYDAVLCRGNSLLGVSAYEGNAIASRDVVKQEMLESLQGMFSKINEGGMIYIDMPTPDQSKPLKPYHSSSDNDTIITTVSYDPITKIRTTNDVKTDPQTGNETITVHQVYPLDPEELIEILHHVGFQRVEKSPLKEAFYIDAYLAFK